MMANPPKHVQPADVYWERFGQFQNGAARGEPSWLQAVRKEGMARFAETGFPTLKDEDWRFTNVAPIARMPFHPVIEPVQHGLGADFIAGLIFGRLSGSKLVFVDGHYAPELSSADKLFPAGARLLNLAEALRHNLPVLDKHLARHAQAGSNAFAALNAAFFTDGAFVYVPAGVAVPEPVQIVHISTSGRPNTTANLRHLVVAEAGSQVTVLETCVSAGGGTRLTNAAVELVVGDEATVEHCRFQDENESALHVSTLQADLGRACKFTTHSLVLGAKLARNNIRAVLGGEGVACILNGLYLTKDDQLADHHMIVEHAKPHCESHEYFNGILDGRSRGVFHGRILVHQDAQKTDAKQTNKNLLLSDDAGVNTKPQLEIYADDVKCTHGATIGQLNLESIFYLRARGIGKEMARRMLMHAFAGEIIERVQHEAIREELDKLVWDRLELNRQISVAR
ncbi:MAG: Fe-S cluster assembly protein SufD [Verrucomicrobiia bacterium]